MYVAGRRDSGRARLGFGSGGGAARTSGRRRRRAEKPSRTDENNEQERKRQRRRHRDVSAPLALWSVAVLLLVARVQPVVASSAPKYSTRLVHTRYGTLRGVVARGHGGEAQVEVYLGVPYATPPLGSLRYMPPVTPSPWRGTRLADAMPPACPQRPPEPSTTTPRAQRAYLERLRPLLANQSEDCLYLNLYVPRPPSATLQPAQQTHAGSFLYFIILPLECSTVFVTVNWNPSSLRCILAIAS